MIPLSLLIALWYFVSLIKAYYFRWKIYDNIFLDKQLYNRYSFRYRKSIYKVSILTHAFYIFSFRDPRVLYDGYVKKIIDRRIRKK